MSGKDSGNAASQLETPRQSDSRKRGLASPADEQELKKQLMYASPGEVEHTEASPGSAVKVGGFSMDALKSVAEFLKASLRPEMERMAADIIDSVLSGFQRRVAVLEDSNASLLSENKALKSRIDVLERKQDELEQYSRRNTLRISGIAEGGDTENTDELVADICGALKIAVSGADICRSHRVGPKPRPGSSPVKGAVKSGAVSGSRPRAIIVRFSTYRARRCLLSARSGLSSCGYRDVFINEDLTKARNTLLFHARQRVKNTTLQGAWSSDGNVLVKDRRGRVTRITHKDELDSLEL